MRTKSKRRVSESFADCLLGRRSGVSRQAFHARKQRSQRSLSHAMLVLDLVTAFRRDVPGLGTRKLHLLLAEPLAKSGIKLGRDKLHKILQTHALVIPQGRTNGQHFPGRVNPENVHEKVAFFERALKKSTIN